EASASEIDIPDVLRPWVGWVQAAIPDYGCSHLQDTLVCAWPGKLDLSVHETGASFRMEVWRDTPGRVALPGTRGFWPQDVNSGAGKLTVHGEEHPSVHLPRGMHTITGRFIWRAIPEVITVPPQNGIVSLSMSGQAVPYPRLDTEGRLWLKEGQAGTVTEADSLRVSIYRRIDDAVPLLITTRLELNVSGRAREVQLGSILIAGSRATTVRGELPIQVEASGEVSVYVRLALLIISRKDMYWRDPEEEDGAKISPKKGSGSPLRGSIVGGWLC
ncbi:MAG: hypothetical protein ACNA8W_09355, partial [Bradymonadaceae bacterium]